MRFEYDDMPSSSKLWIYQANRILKRSEEVRIQQLLDIFLEDWHSHQQNLKAFGCIKKSAFILIMVDENVNMASGCSIDKSVHFIQTIEKEIGVDLMNRMIFAVNNNGDLKLIDRKGFEDLYSTGAINDNTLVYNNLVNTKEEFEKKWEIPLAESWHKQMI